MRDVTSSLDMTEFVRPGDTVVWTQGAGEPLTLISRLLEQRHEIGPFTVFLAGSYSGILGPEHADVITVLGLGAVGANRSLCAAGSMRVLPIHFSAVPSLIERGELHVDVVLAQLSDRAPTAAQRFSYGAANGYLGAAMHRARTVLAELNEQAPWTHATEPVTDRVDAFVRVSTDLVQVPRRPPTPIDERIAVHAAELVDDGAVLQLGIGGVPAAVAAQLGGHRRLGIHTGVLGDDVQRLIESGSVDNSTKKLDRGVAVAGALAGSADLYVWAHQNPTLRLEPVAYTHAQRTLAQLDGLVSINSALEVDLTGQVSSEVAAGRYLGTIGGLADFARGALAADRGRSIVALPSRAGREGARSAVVTVCTSGFVSLGRADADVVVTEYGIAQLRGLPIRERIRRMIDIAHPDDRDQLAKEGDAIAGR